MQPLNLPKFDVKLAVQNGKPVIFDRLRRKYVAATPEEWVRQHFVHFLLSEKHYPESLIANEIGIKLNNTQKRCDTVVFNTLLEPLVIIEYKAPSVEITDRVFDQIVRYNMVLRAKYLIVSNGLQHFCCQINYEKDCYCFLTEIPDFTKL
ncbi:MAG: type I restriction enzyme HsdR N-terminal domain-containing protein [Massilibacteroides sp.]|nr:type I restriction enzyme HsdR N-terminal domain-containing protein [Massilibacteroides sp.]MDD3063380.1 type I restriction enzyme HsdR N-terminal domain-containing protein [Massilibacteroides sp.]MDD4114133.1 type I restriction enzyme HsdR N-terminal domain-containing protein [Massilibacteroides sp.]MDD4659102.1 type I restriction enzyme HsdR N-terminal domain-containing protein [Massilibacteroides sp.]